MSTIHPQLKTHHWRYATKAFDSSRKISNENWSTLEKALLLTPSSFGLQPWKFIVITNPAIKTALRAQSWHQSQVEDCSHLIVFCHRLDLDVNYVDRVLLSISKARGVTLDSLAGYRSVLLDFINKKRENDPRNGIAHRNSRQVYLALANLIQTAAALEIDTCPMEGFDPEGYSRELGLTGTGFAPTVVCAVGYRSKDDRYAGFPKARFDETQVLERR